MSIVFRVPLGSLNHLIETSMATCGVNKKREISRLVYEISKKEKILPEKILNSALISGNSYPTLKKKLLARRFPYASAHSKTLEVHLPKLEIKPEYQAVVSDQKPRPKNIYIEEIVYKGYLTKRLKERFPFSVIGVFLRV